MEAYARIAMRFPLVVKRSQGIHNLQGYSNILMFFVKKGELFSFSFLKGSRPEVRSYRRGR